MLRKALDVWILMGVFVRTRQLKLDKIVRRLRKCRCFTAWKVMAKEHIAVRRIARVFRLSALHLSFVQWHTSTIKAMHTLFNLVSFWRLTCDSVDCDYRNDWLHLSEKLQ
jgi:hypothetical protein